MKPPTPLRLPAFLLAFSLASAGPVGLAGQGLGFHPEEATVLSKSFHTECAIALDAIDVLMNGQAIDPQMLGIASDVEATFGYELDLEDEYVGVSGGRPTELLRTFGTIEGWFTDPEGEESRKSGDDVTDRTVRFLWDEDAGEYERSFVEGSGDEDGLDVWNEDLDLRALLPAGDVEEGASWGVSGAALAGVLIPGFDAQRALDNAVQEDVPGELLDTLRELVDGGSGTCTYEGLEEEGDRTFAVISLKASLDHDLEFDADMFGAELGGADLDELDGLVLIELEFEGRALWDLEAGHFRSFEMEGYGSVELEIAVSAAAMGMELEGTAQLSFDLERSATAE